jgi:hypothetical protein
MTRIVHQNSVSTLKTHYITFDKRLFTTYTQFKKSLKMTIVSKQTIDTIEIKIVKLEIYIVCYE